MRRHQFQGQLHGAQVVYLRAQRGGACDYVDDGRCVREGGEREKGLHGARVVYPPSEGAMGRGL